MRQMAQSFCISGSASSGTTDLKTTLYELIEAVHEEIKPGEEHWVSLIVDHMLFSGKSFLSIAKNKRLSYYR
jgi:hypothetical protein